MARTTTTKPKSRTPSAKVGAQAEEGQTTMETAAAAADSEANPGAPATPAPGADEGTAQENPETTTTGPTEEESVQRALDVATADQRQGAQAKASRKKPEPEAAKVADQDGGEVEVADGVTLSGGDAKIYRALQENGGAHLGDIAKAAKGDALAALTRITKATGRRLGVTGRGEDRRYILR